MGIERIEIEGFRSLKHVVWEPSNLNVLIGPNGSGKSNVLEGIEFLSHIIQGRLEEAVERFGGLAILAWNHSAREIRWRAQINTDPSRSTPRHVEYELALNLRDDLGNFSVGAERLAVPGEPIPLVERDGEIAKIKEPDSPEVKEYDIGPLSFLLPVPMESHLRGRKDDGRKFARDFLIGAKCYQNMPVAYGAELRRSAKARREDWVQPDGQNLVSVIHTHYPRNDHFTAAINDAMRAAFGNDFDKLITPPAEDTRVQLRLKRKSLNDSLSAAELSDGILRFLLLITILSQPNPPPLIAIDEPETGLHPRMQHIIAEYAIEASQKTQVILTTHSPEFLDAFSASDVVPKVTVAFWEDGQTMLKTPREDVLQHWLKEYTLGRLMTSGELEEIAE